MTPTEQYPASATTKYLLRLAHGTSEKLERCSKCSHKTILEIVRYPGFGATESYALICEKCFIMTPDFPNREDLADYWNTRTPDAALLAKLAGTQSADNIGEFVESEIKITHKLCLQSQFANGGFWAYKNIQQLLLGNKPECDFTTESLPANLKPASAWRPEEGQREAKLIAAIKQISNCYNENISRGGCQIIASELIKELGL